MPKHHLLIGLASIGAVAVVGLAGCGDAGRTGLPDPSGELDVGKVTAVRLDDDGYAVRTFPAEENTIYTLYAAGAQAEFAASPHLGDDEHVGPVATAGYSTVFDAEIVIRGEPGATVDVGLHYSVTEVVPLGGTVAGELAIGECRGHELASGGVDEIVAVLESDADDLIAEADFDVEPVGSDDDGNPVYRTSNDSYLGDDTGVYYDVCNAGAQSAGYRVSSREHLDPGEQPSLVPAVDGDRTTLTGTLPPGGVAVHTLTVPAGYDLYVEVGPEDALDVELAVFPQGVEQRHDFAVVGEPEWLRLPLLPADGQVRLEVRAVGGTGGSYELAIH
jgi:hypothetical protein